MYTNYHNLPCRVAVLCSLSILLVKGGHCVGECYYHLALFMSVKSLQTLHIYIAVKRNMKWNGELNVRYVFVMLKLLS